MSGRTRAGHIAVASGIAVFSGFTIMVLEIVGMRLLARDFGSSFYVWTSQIGVVLVALSFGYVAGGFWADRFPDPRFVGWLMFPAAVFTTFIPDFAGPLMGWIVGRHPLDQEIPLIWQKLDPAVGAALIFLPPCFVLATVPPYLIRVASRAVVYVGRVSGLVYGAGSAGSIAGVFISGYFLIDLFNLSHIFRGAGVLMLALAVACWLWNPPTDPDDVPR